jgi:DNA replication and repair protein RecF
MFKTAFVENLKATNFRNFDSKKHSFSKNLVAIIGDNGVGKTNLLEAISMLAPGRGIRSAKLEDLENQVNDNYYADGWGVNIDLKVAKNLFEFSSSKAPSDRNRKTFVNSDKISKQQDLTNYVNVLWLTPLDDSVFVEDKSVRRKFFDRMVFNLFPEHLQNLQRYEYYVRERIKILQNDFSNEVWLLNIEKSISELNSSIAHSRVDMIKYLNAELELIDKKYPKAFLFFESLFEDMYLNGKSSSEIELASQNMLLKNRRWDFEKGRTSEGSHKTDFKCLFKDKNMDAKLCSTGEQKSLLLSIILAKTKLLTKKTGRTPILLLDEIVSHLDKSNATQFIKDLNELNTQCFMTSTNLQFFEEIENENLEIITLNS